MNEDTLTSIHAHEVLNLITNQPSGWPIESLTNEVYRLWGTEARFHTCSKDALKWDDLREFLIARGKIRIDAGTVYPSACGCNH